MSSNDQCGICGMSPCELTMAITALGNAISDALTKNELLLLNVVLKQLSDVIATIVVQRDFCSDAWKTDIKSDQK